MNHRNINDHRLNKDINAQRSVVNNILRMDLDDRRRICEFIEMLNSEIDRLESEINNVPLSDIVKYRTMLKNYFLVYIRNWFDLRLMLPLP